MKILLRVNRAILKIIEVIAVALLCGIAIMIMTQIISRVVGIGLQWPEEMSRFAFVGVVFLGSAVVMGTGKHITIEMLLDKLPEKIRHIWLTVVHLLVAVFCSMAIEGTLRTIASAVDVHANSLEWFQYNYVYYTVLVSFVLMVVESVLNAVLEVLRLLGKEEVSI